MSPASSCSLSRPIQDGRKPRREGNDKGALRWSDAQKGKLLTLNATTAFEKKRKKQRQRNEVNCAFLVVFAQVVIARYCVERGGMEHLLIA